MEEVQEGDNWSEELRIVSRMQEEIGPNAFMEGCITRKWREIQNTHLRAMQSRRNPSRWTKELIKKVWMVSWDMWDTRNGWVHREALTRKQQKSAQLDAEIDRLHLIGEEDKRFYTHADRSIFHVRVTDLKNKSDYQKGTWINAANKIITRDRQKVARDEETRKMREFLRPGSTTRIERRREHIIGQWENNPKVPEGTRRGPTNQED